MFVINKNVVLLKQLYGIYSSDHVIALIKEYMFFIFILFNDFKNTMKCLCLNKRHIVPPPLSVYARVSILMLLDLATVINNCLQLCHNIFYHNY